MILTDSKINSQDTSEILSATHPDKDTCFDGKVRIRKIAAPMIAFAPFRMIVPSGTSLYLNILVGNNTAAPTLICQTGPFAGETTL
jgi:hypothetical protein